MTADLSADTQAILLLTALLIVGRGAARGQPAPLSDGEYDRLARRLRECGREPADLLRVDEAGAALEECASGLERDRLERLLGRGFLLGQAVERWRTRGIWVVSRADADYPRRLKKRLGKRAPPLLYGFGDRSVLDGGGLAVVGSRNVDDETIAHAERAGRLAADARHVLISGGARGIDRAAMRGALEAGGRALGVLADGLERAVVRRGDRDVLMEGRLVLISSYDPAAGFQVWRAMGRNKVVYALADAALVVSADHGKGGTWAGAVEQLEKYGRVPVYVRADGVSEKGLAELRRRGARVWPDPDTPEALEDVLDAPPPPEGRPPERDAVLPDLQVEPAPAEVGPADALFAKVRDTLARTCADEPKSAGEVVKVFGMSEPQVGDWLRRAVEEGTLEKIPGSVRYRATGRGKARAAGSSDELLATVRSLLVRECANRPQAETDVAEALGVRRYQARDWLRRMSSEGALQRTNRPVRYRAVASLFDHASPIE